MKAKKWLILAAVALTTASCSKDNNGNGFTQVKTIEHNIYLAIKEYRESKGLTGAFVEQYLMVAEAQLYSLRMAAGQVPLGLSGLDDHWASLNEKYTFYNQAALVLKTTTADEDQILAEILETAGADTTLQGDLTQCGVGVESDSEGFNYVTVLLAKADS